MSTLPFCNNLKRGDRVLHAESKRVGTVAVDPGESSRDVAVTWQGNERYRFCDVMVLRLVTGGKPEEVAPVDGEPPAPKTGKPARAATVEQSAISVLKKERDEIDAEMKRLDARFKELREKRDRLSRAITVLEAPPAPPTPA